MSNASQTEAYPCLQRHEEELPTLIRSDEAPSLIAIPSWPPAPRRLVPAVQEKRRIETPERRRVAEAFPLRPNTLPADAARFGPAPHELSPFGRSPFSPSPQQRVASSPVTLVAAYVALGASAFWAAWSLARFM